jgi:hypothetical protein
MSVASFPPGFFDEPEPEMIFLLDLEDEPDTDPGIDTDFLDEQAEIDRQTNLQVARYGDQA